MPTRIADSGLLIAMNSDSPREREWARKVMRKWGGPFLTCEGAIVEACHFCPPALIARVVEDNSFIVDFSLPKQIQRVRELLEKYQDRPMDMTDACIVRMTELFPDCVVFTVDHDFDFYRRNGDQIIPVEYPPELR